MKHNTFSIREALNFGWNIVSKDLGLYAGATFLYFIIVMILSALTSHSRELFVWNFVLRMVAFIIELVFAYNVFAIALKAVRHQKVVFADFYTYESSKKYFNFLAAWILKAVFSIPIFAVGALLVFLFVKISLFLVPVIIFITGVALFYYLSVIFFVDVLVVSGTHPVAAFKQSMHLTHGMRWKIFAFYIVSGIIIFISALPFGLGLLVTYPLFFIAVVHIYTKMVGGANEHHVKDAEVVSA